MTDSAGQRSAFVALVGKPNVGKSSLLNRLLGEKIAIVSPRPQTTRTRITGVLTQGETQLVFFDTPGLHTPKTALSRYMVGQIGDSVADVDLAVLVVEPDGGISDAERTLIETFKKRKLPAIAAVNKIDTLKSKELMLPKMVKLADAYPFREIVPISALTGDGTDILLGLLLDAAEEGGHYFDDDTLTDQPERVICGEIVREKVLTFMQEEIPHGIAVTVEEMKDRTGAEGQELVDIQAVIFCERDTHKGMVIGKGGAMLKRIATAARKDLESFLGVKVNLKCWVKVKNDWRNQEGSLRDLGFR